MVTVIRYQREGEFIHIAVTDTRQSYYQKYKTHDNGCTVLDYEEVWNTEQGAVKRFEEAIN